MIAQAELAGTNVTASGVVALTNGVYYVLSATNLTLPVGQWSAVATNVTDGMGQFNFSVPVDPTASQRFYLLQLP